MAKTATSAPLVVALAQPTQAEETRNGGVADGMMNIFGDYAQDTAQQGYQCPMTKDGWEANGELRLPKDAAWLKTIQDKAIEDLDKGQAGTDKQRALEIIDRLRNLAHNSQGSAEWPDDQFGEGSDPEVVRYLETLRHATEQRLLTSAVETIGQGYFSARLPLASGYNAVIAFLLIYLIYKIMGRKAGAAEPDRQGGQVTEAYQDECDLISDTITVACAYLAIVPLTSILLIILELNGTTPWLISSSYVCLISGIIIAARPSLLTNLWDRNSLLAVGQRLILGIMTITALGCLVHSKYAVPDYS
ncbi:hypothetical protein DL89DRAFT_263748 [Linderina pennispora]|uniref:Uncharacterized protein n=1 Tax=Linderina pennispora TaxID=61395 RepID=A0A1Y1WJS3_9FUNG|nr:uncharacterized protein DL89DRAFT_263748 [Linderina pennispora]ORX73733.1 hypothetical protein DL89DRAFT_263748 [Linderina pennispora]